MAGNLRAFLSELAGTFAWTFFAAGAVCADSALGGRLGAAGIAAAQGAGIAAAFALFGRCAPGGFNPALTLSLAALKRLDSVKAALALVCQLLGAALAGMLLARIFSGYPVVRDFPFLGTPHPMGLGFRSATLLEAVLTFFLTLAAAKPWKEMTDGQIVGAAAVVGAVAVAAGLVGGALTGAALNPARAFGSAAASGYWTEHYVYWFGPLAGAALGAAAAGFLREK